MSALGEKMARRRTGDKPLFKSMMTRFTEACVTRPQWVNTLRPKQNGRHFTDDIFKCIFLNENDWISLKISLKFVPKGPINNIPSLVQTMAWRRPGDKPLSEPMVVSLPTHICVTRPQWVNTHKWHSPMETLLEHCRSRYKYPQTRTVNIFTTVINYVKL